MSRKTLVTDPATLQYRRQRRNAKKAAERRSRLLPFACVVDGCGMTFSTDVAIGVHRRREHGIMGRMQRGDSFAREFESVRKKIVPGRNVDSAALWERLGADLFGRKRSVAA